MRKICVVTGTRAEYGLFKPVMKEIDRCADLQLQLLVTGMHLAPEFGHTVAEIEQDGFRPDATVDMLFSSDTGAAMAKGVGIGIYGLAQALEALQPDIVLVLGDRVEAFAAAGAATLSNLVLAHIHGGDRSRGGVDEAMRHAITKLAHIHLAASQASRERIVRMGENPDHVFVVGAPGLDTGSRMGWPAAAGPDQHSALAWPANVNPEHLFNISLEQPLLLVIQHPVSTVPAEAARQMQETMAAIAELELPTIAIYPNADAGGRAMIAVLEDYARLPFLRLSKSLPRHVYLSLLRHASVLVGNSSSGIIEAPAVGVPVVNIGSRQEGREAAATCIQVDYDRQEIAAAIRATLAQGHAAGAALVENPYWQEGTAGRIVAILRTIELGPELRQKQIAY